MQPENCWWRALIAAAASVAEAKSVASSILVTQRSGAAKYLPSPLRMTRMGTRGTGKSGQEIGKGQGNGGGMRGAERKGERPSVVVSPGRNVPGFL